MTNPCLGCDEGECDEPWQDYCAVCQERRDEREREEEEEGGSAWDDVPFEKPHAGYRRLSDERRRGG